MTQENKLERIKYLAEELATECKKQGLTHVLAINVDKEHVLNGGGGNANEMIECVTSLEQVIENQVGVPYGFIQEIVMSEDECDCPGCKASRGEIENEKVPDDVLTNFLAALFSIAERGGLDDRN
ncbi:hypothetical protein VBG40_11580 [Vagococcus fluvialis]|uniref:hypothetical protein n=1 Tax=Vagococcus fluvialis TaxID=2738 RepID=UPI003797F6E2